MSRTQSEKQAQMKYDKKYRGMRLIKGYYLKCHIIHDADIICVLESKKNKNGYIKSLIRNDRNEPK